eukprot:Skav233191  [mRNA]  locus=scaffold24:300757:303549:- [translate_table: standard]
MAGEWVLSVDWFLLNFEPFEAEAKQGVLFTTTRANPELAVLDETVELSFFYGDALVLGQPLAVQIPRRSVSRSARGDPARDEIAHAETWYERELEIEKEVEKEVERQLPSVKPRPEEDWEVSKLLTAQSIRGLGVKVLALPQIFASTVSQQQIEGSFEAQLGSVGVHTKLSQSVRVLSELDELGYPSSAQESLKKIQSWPDSAVFVTTNFHYSILGHENLNMDDYLRPVDAVIAFPGSRELLLLSEREADRALDLFWKATCGIPQSSSGFFNRLQFWKASSDPSSQPQNFFTNLVLWRSHFYSNLPGLVPSTTCGGGDILEDAARLVSIQAFMGDTQFKHEAQKMELRELINFVEEHSGDARAVSVRGMTHRYERSDLAWIMNAR